MEAALIWGASGSIGRALLKRLNSQDWTTVAVSRRPDELDDLASISIEADVGNPEAIQQAVEQAQAAVAVVDLWVYTVGDILSQRAVGKGAAEAAGQRHAARGRSRRDHEGLLRGSQRHAGFGLMGVALYLSRRLSPD